MNSNNLITFVTILLSIWLVNDLFDDSDDELHEMKRKVENLEDRVRELELEDKK